MYGHLKLIIGNVMTRIDGGMFPFAEIDARLSYTLPGSWFNPYVRKGGWDGKEHLLEGNAFPTGLLDFVIEILRAKNVSFTLHDAREFPTEIASPTLEGIELRPYQMLAVASMLMNKRGVVQIPTAGGKTYIAAAVIRALGVPTAYIVHTKTLLSQTFEMFQTAGLDVGMFGSGIFEEGREVTVFMVQTLMSHIKRGSDLDLSRYKSLIVDECHHLASDGRKASWYIASTEFTEAAVRFGLSATPVMKKSGMLLQAATGPVIHEVHAKQLQDKGFIAQSAPEFVTIEDPLMPLSYTYQEAYLEGIVQNPFRNNVAIDEAIRYAKDGHLVMLFVERIEHGEILNTELGLKCGSIPYWFLSGLNDRAEIEEVKRLAKDRKINILVVTRKLFGEGVDIPAVDVLINLAGGKSAIAFTQMFGRGLRKSEGKDRLKYIDFYDETHRYLRAHSAARLRHCKRLKQTAIRTSPKGKTDVAGNPQDSLPHPRSDRRSEGRGKCN